MMLGESLNPATATGTSTYLDGIKLPLYPSILLLDHPFTPLLVILRHRLVLFFSLSSVILY